MLKIRYVRILQKIVDFTVKSIWSNIMINRVRQPDIRTIRLTNETPIKYHEHPFIRSTSRENTIIFARLPNTPKINIGVK